MKTERSLMVLCLLVWIFSRQQVVSKHTCSHYLHTAGWNSWTQRHAASLVCFLDQCVTACSPEKHTSNEHTPDQQEHAQLPGWHPETFKRHNCTRRNNMYEYRTQTSRGRVDPNYTVDLCHSQSKERRKNWGFLPFSNPIVGHKRNKAIMGKMKAMTLVYEWCG